MAIHKWSETVVGAELENDPAFSRDLDAVLDEVGRSSDTDVLLDFSSVRYINSSNVTKLLKLHRLVTQDNGRQLKLCAISSDVRGVLRISGLARRFDYAPDIRTALVAIQAGVE